MAATSAPLVEIAAQAISNMRIAMRGSAYSAEGVGPVAVLAEYKSVSEQFKKQFPVGGVAAVSGDAPAEKTQVDPRHLARVNAVRFAK